MKFSDEDLNLLKSFLDPPTFMIKEELPLSNSDSGGIQKVTSKVSGIAFKEDPIWELFNPENEGTWAWVDSIIKALILP